MCPCKIFELEESCESKQCARFSFLNPANPKDSAGRVDPQKERKEAAVQTEDVSRPQAAGQTESIRKVLATSSRELESDELQDRFSQAKVNTGCRA
jgi:hypothetical protein